MSEQTTATTPAAGSIYDLGYRGYDGDAPGPELRLYVAVHRTRLRAIFGLGRSIWARFSLRPGGHRAAAVDHPARDRRSAPAEFEFIAPEEILRLHAIVLALFCAVAAPELIGRDQRQRTLALYFSRALSRLDYAGARSAHWCSRSFLVLVMPQILLSARQRRGGRGPHGLPGRQHGPSIRRSSPARSWLPSSWAALSLASPSRPHGAPSRPAPSSPPSSS